MQIIKSFFLENKRVIPFLIFMFIFILIFSFIIFNFIYNNKTNKLNIIHADTRALREKGLSGMDSLPSNSIMLFTFESPDKYGIWMKDMKFPIDIIWLDNEYRIIHIEDDISPDTFPKVFYPKENSLYIIEANTDFIEKNALKVGNILESDLSK